MTFTLPENLAAQFVRRVPARERSKYLAEALSKKLAERDQRLIASCLAANNDPEVSAIEKEFDAISEQPKEPWTRSSPRRGMVGKARSRSRRRNS